MMKTTIIMVLIALLQIESYSALKLTVEPVHFKGSEGATVTMSCNLDSSEAAAKEVIKIKLSKKGEKALVLLNKNNSITYDTAPKDLFEATGKIDENTISKSFLQVVFKKPQTTDTGSYACYIYYMDESGALAEDKARAFLTVDDPNITKMLASVEMMKKEVETRVDKVKSLTEKDAGINDRIGKLEERIRTKYEELSKKSVPLVAFSASTSRTIHPKYRMALVFDNVIMQQGQGYDGTSGVFTAPKDGVYVFYLTLQSGAKKCMLAVNLVMNGNSIGQLKVGDKNMVDQTSVSTVARLRPGDSVKTYVSYSSPSCFLTAGKRNVFSGFMVNSAI